MIIEIEGYETNALVTGKNCSISKLCWQVNKAFKHMESHEAFVPVFCRLFRYDLISCGSDLEADFVIDIDTHRVYAPYRGE